MGSSEGIQLEYIAIFLAVLFPGALVALNHELLQIKPHSASLRIYCAGIWHNAVFCAACGLALLLLPLMLSPFYIHGEGPVVLGISGSSPVSGYLSPGDVIMSLDGTKISNAREWLEMANFLEKQTLVSSESQVVKGFLTVNRKTYCVPSSLVEKSVTVLLRSNQTACPDEHFAFVSVPCFESSAQSSNKEAYDIQRINNNGYCLNSADIVKLRSCKSLWTTDIRSGCICSENELCMSPVQMPGVVWVEIMYRSPYSLQCMKLENNLTVVESSDSGDDCHKTFLFVGDVISMARSVSMTSFQPRVASPFGSYLADMIEKILACTFQVSVALALLNSLPESNLSFYLIKLLSFLNFVDPANLLGKYAVELWSVHSLLVKSDVMGLKNKVYGLDGESILEASSFCVTVLSPGRRRLLLQASLFGGSIISCLVFIRIFLIKFW
uniref:Endopeptidase S2P n=1 Tax=Chenopodium quinoa TaxID=63459 RepID=A0A803MFM0_CHEQI